MRLETERLILREPKMEDAEAMHRIRFSGFVMKYNVMTEMSVEELRKQLMENAQSGASVHLVLKETGEIIGMIGCGKDSLRWDVKAVMIDYFLGEEYARKGYMTEALRAYITHIFDTQDAALVSARVFVGNEASARLLKGLGFAHEGTLRHAVGTPSGFVHDDQLFSVLRGEWSKTV